MKRLIPFVLFLLIGVAGCKQKDVGPDIASKLVDNYEIWDFVLSSNGTNYKASGTRVLAKKKSNDEIHVEVYYTGTTGIGVIFEDDLKLVEQNPLSGTMNISMTGKYTTGNANPGSPGVGVKYWFFLRTEKDGYKMSVNAKSYL